MRGATFTAALMGLMAVAVIIGAILFISQQFITPIAEFGGEPVDQRIKLIQSQCETWRTGGLFIDIYMPSGLSDDFGMIADSCVDINGNLDYTICRSNCIRLQKILEYCNPDSSGFSMRCVEGGAESSRLALEGGA